MRYCRNSDGLCRPPRPLISKSHPCALFTHCLDRFRPPIAQWSSSSVRIVINAPGSAAAQRKIVMPSWAALPDEIVGSTRASAVSKHLKKWCAGAQQLWWCSMQKSVGTTPAGSITADVVINRMNKVWKKIHRSGLSCVSAKGSNGC